jgi:hypothetical protein
MQLVPDARQGWRWYSNLAMALAGAIESAWLAVPDDLKADISPDAKSAVTVALMVLGIFGRMVKQ